MKKYILAVLTVICMAGSAEAKIVSSESQRITVTEAPKEKKTKAKDDCSNYNRLYFGYAPTKFKYDGEKMFDHAWHGFTTGWTGGFNVTGKRLPLYVEAGLNLTCDFYSYDYYDYYYDYSVKYKLLDFEIPLSATYRYQIGNTGIKVAPYFGFHLKLNAICGDGVAAANIARFGLQLGANLDYKHCHFGIGWDKDLTAIERDYYDRKVTTGGPRINIGWVF